MSDNQTSGEIPSIPTPSEQTVTPPDCGSPPGTVAQPLSIGDGAPCEDRQAAVRYYLDRGFTVVPLLGPDEGSPSARGKAPKVPGSQTWTPENLNEETIQQFWGEGQDSNLAILLRGDHVVIDLDSKEDGGTSADNWLAGQCRLHEFPRERTAGGFHVHARCPDLPSFMSRYGTPFRGKLVSELAAGVHAELHFPAADHTPVTSPSIHPSGTRYEWVVGGEIPSIPWAELKAIFGFEEPDSATSQQRAEGNAELLRQFLGDIKTLNIVALTQEAGIYGRSIDADSGRHSVRCPFRNEHSNADQPWTEDDTSTIIFEAREEGWPGFYCSHAHCHDRRLAEFLVAVDSTDPGIVDRHCAQEYVRLPRSRSRNDRPQIELPGKGRPQGEFAVEVAEALTQSGTIFCRNDHIVEVREELPGDEMAGFKLDVILPAAAVTRFEREIEFGRSERVGEGTRRFVPSSITKPEILLKSPELRDRLPSIQRILHVPIPILYEDRIVFPEPGYDPRFNSFLASKVRRPVALSSLDEAFEVINDIMGNEDGRGFCWKNEQSFVHGIARLITPMCRGIMGWEKAPVFIFRANRERIGKDTAAEIPIILFTGRPCKYPPLEKGDDAEMRKRITTALRAAQPFVHIGNLRGFINFPSLEDATDAFRTWTDRLLGENLELTLVNEMEYSFSANLGAKWTPDIEGRSRIIDFFFAGEYPNLRQFRHPNIFSYVKIHRERILDAIFTCIDHWDRSGRPCGPTPFASFPLWSRVVGGVHTAAGFGDPCLPHADQDGIAGDSDTVDMKRLFELAAQEFGENRASKQQLYDLIQRQEEPPFGYLKLEEHDGRTALGIKLKNFYNRELSGITMRIDDSDKHRLRYTFRREMQTLQTLQTFSLGRGNFLRPSMPVLAPETGNGGSGESCTSVVGDAEKVCKVCKVCIDGPSGSGVRAVDLLTPSHFPPVYAERNWAVDRFLESLATHPGHVALDIETFGEGPRGALDPFTNSVRLVSLAFGREIFLLDAQAIAPRMPEVIAALNRKVIIVHNALFDILTLRLKYGLRPAATFCTMTVSRVLSAGLDLKHKLAPVVERYLGVKLRKDQATSDWSAPVLSNEQLDYAANDVRHLSQLALKLLETGQHEGLDRVMKLEIDLIPVLLDMEQVGFPVDRQRLEILIAEMEVAARDGETAFKSVLGNTEINANSPDQVLEAFGRLGIELPDTKEETLGGVDHPAARELLRYRQATKLLQQAQGYLAADANDGRIHSEWDSSSVRTGRISCKEPNLQGASRGRLREVFRPGEGRKLVVADYSQIELRVVAVQADDTAMLEIFAQGQDIHCRTAAEILGKSLDEVTPDERRRAKAVNFGFLYGQGAKGFVRYARVNYELDISQQEAHQFRQGWLRLFPEISAWQERCRRLAGAGASEARTLMGRRRHLPSQSEKNWWKRYTTLLNTPIQGTAGDGLKRSMLRMSRELDADCVMVATVHDEIIVECPEAKADAVLEQVRNIMVEEMSTMLNGRVPIEVEASVCDSWAEKG